MTTIEEKLLHLPTYPQELGLNLSKPEDRFKWFLASILFARRISASIAKNTYRCFEAEGITDLEAIIRAGWDRLVEVLDSGGYVRYDFSTASNLLELAAKLKEKYGSLENLYSEAKDSRDLEKRLLEFKGVGLTAVGIFLRELKPFWEKARPKPSPLAREMASVLGLEEDALAFEPQLVKLNLEFCKRKRCSICPLGDACPEVRR